LIADVKQPRRHHDYQRHHLHDHRRAVQVGRPAICTSAPGWHRTTGHSALDNGAWSTGLQTRRAYVSLSRVHPIGRCAKPRSTPGEAIRFARRQYAERLPGDPKWNANSHIRVTNRIDSTMRCTQMWWPSYALTVRIGGGIGPIHGSVGFRLTPRRRRRRRRRGGSSGSGLISAFVGLSVAVIMLMWVVCAGLIVGTVWLFIAGIMLIPATHRGRPYRAPRFPKFW
jgi:hypothetical protein